MSYIVIECRSLNDLTAKCSEAIRSGYIPAGGLSVDDTHFRQALYRPATVALVDQYQGR